MAEQTRNREYPAHWEADVVLRDGATARLRPISPDDAEAVQRMHAGQSQSSIYLRYFTYKSSLTPKEVQRFTVVDYVDRVAFVILRGTEILGIGRYDRLDDPLEAEVAFNIADAHQGRGLGSILMEHLAVAARENGIRRFSAEVLPENRKMLSVFQESGFEVSRKFDDGVVVVEFSIHPTEKVRAVMESREHRAEAKSVRELLNPRSIAVIGASRSWGSVGYALLENIIEGGFTGPVYGINPEAMELAGMISRASLDEVPEQVDLAVIAVPPARMEAVIADCARNNVRGLLVVTEVHDGSEESLALQSRLVSTARSQGMRVIGPASAGVINTDPQTALNASVAPFMPARGPIGVFSQSAAIGATLFAAAHRRGLGLTAMISAGHRADVSGNDAMQYFEDDASSAAVGVYLESFGNPRKFSRIVRRLSRSKPVIVARSNAMGRRLPPGHSTRTTQAPAATVNSMLDQAGVIQVENHSDLMDLLQVLACQPIPAGERIGVLGNAEAMNRLVIDAAQRQGMKVTRVDLIEALDAGHTVDDAIRTFTRGVREAIESQQIDGLVVVVQSGMHQLPGQTRDLAEAIAEASEDSSVTVVTSFTAVLDDEFRISGIVGADSGERVLDRTDLSTPTTEADSEQDPATAAVQLQSGVPVFANPSQAATMLSKLVRYRAWRDAEHGSTVQVANIDRERAEALVTQWVSNINGTELLRLSTRQTVELLDCYGISVLDSRTFDTDDEAVAAADELGWPVAIKAVDSFLRHRLDLGGVRLNIPDEESLRHNIWHMRTVLAPYGDPQLEIQTMAPTGQGCTVTALEDPLLGPVVSFGLSGDAVELLDDWVHMVPPLTDQDLESMIRTPRAAARLFGHSGMPAVDAEALKDLLARMVALKDDLPQVARMRFNPVLASESTVTVLQAEIDVANAAQRTDSARRAMRDS
ncbi:MAG: bifunctional acetate--CoA ligase family protein/GNAT family N-acetyltransferase [Micrococcaceae bacterium]